MDLKGRNALVTGAGRSLGAAIAVRLAREGANVAVNSRSTPDEIEAVAEACRSHGVDAIAVQADVSIKEGVEQLRQAVTQQFPLIDILINNVGVSPTVPFMEMNDEDWHTVMAINAHSMYYCTKAFVEGMVQRKWGRIINITGHAYLKIAFTSGAHVKASKAAAVGFTRALSGELAEYGITVNHVAPGLMDTPPRRNKYYRDWKDPEQRPWGAEEKVREVPLGRAGKPEELAGLVAFLCGEEAVYLTGQTYLVNGGQYAL
jgi:NAD(P)-dependent dehydrogenase (short-subunit alcohol dehydrogenase family)